VRNSDSHILFIGRTRFIKDDRYELVASRHGRWTLKLRYAGAADAGKYECQVSSKPKISKTFSLRVVGECWDLPFIQSPLNLKKVQAIFCIGCKCKGCEDMLM